MANRNKPFVEGMIFHSDRGTQYVFKQTVNLKKFLKLEQSMSGKGNGWDDAVTESFSRLSNLKWSMVSNSKQESRCARMYLNILNPNIIIKGDSQH